MIDFFETDPSSSVDDSYKHIEINLLEVFWKALKTLFDANRWNDEEGVQYLLAAGLAALLDESQSTEFMQVESGDQSVIRKLQDEQIRMYGRYAVIKHKVNELVQTIGLLETQLAAT